MSTVDRSEKVVKYDGAYSLHALLRFRRYLGFHDRRRHPEIHAHRRSDSLKQAAGSVNAPVFIARYGGDEFIFIVHSDNEEVPDKLVRNIHKKIRAASDNTKLPFNMSVAIGYDELRRENDSFRECLERADRNCYVNKEQIKIDEK